MVSVVIATYNEQKNIGRLLKSLEKQSLKKIEIIVVDNNSQDKTRDIAKKFTSLVFNIGPERSSQRNFGIKKAKYNYILFLDADMEVDKNLLKECVRTIQKTNASGIFIEEQSRGKSFLSKIKALEKQIYKNTQLEAARFFKKSDLIKVGGFDERLIAGEDWDLSQRIKKIGFLKKKGGGIYHWEENSLFSDLKKKYYYARNIQKYTHKYPALSKNQLSVKSRLKILFKNPLFIAKNPHTFLALFVLKSFHFLIYLFSKSNLIEDFTSTATQSALVLENAKKNFNIVKNQLKTKGLVFVITKSLPSLSLFILKHFEFKYLQKKRHFTLNGKKYQYFYHPYNFTYFGERCVEIPIIHEEIQKNQKSKILEIGNVLSHYFATFHDVVDKYEKAPNVINQDITKFKAQKQYDLIVSISTIEHVGWDGEIKSRTKILKAIKNIKNLLSSGGCAKITLPIGYNPYLDEILKRKNGKLFNQNYFLKRISKDGRWRQVEYQKVKNTKFNYPFPFANAILVGIINK